MGFDVTAVGTLNVDIIINGDAPREMGELTQWVAESRVEVTAAGSAGYLAVDLARLGCRVNLVSAVADDLFGSWIKDALTREGVCAEDVAVSPGAVSGLGIYMLLFGSKKRPLTGRLATHPPWPAELAASAEAGLKSSRLLHLSGYLHYPAMRGAPTEALFQKAKACGLITSLDPQFPFEEVKGPWLPLFGNVLEYVDILFTDDHEAKSITGASDPEAAAKSLLDLGPGLVAVKLGQDGAILADRNRMVRQGPFEVDHVSDSIGAGDAFDAGVLHGVLHGFDLSRTARFASAVAALTLAGMGGTQTAPSTSQVESFLASR